MNFFLRGFTYVLEPRKFEQQVPVLQVVVDGLAPAPPTPPLIRVDSFTSYRGSNYDLCPDTVCLHSPDPSLTLHQ